MLQVGDCIDTRPREAKLRLHPGLSDSSTHALTHDACGFSMEDILTLQITVRARILWV